MKTIKWMFSTIIIMGIFTNTIFAQHPTSKIQLRREEQRKQFMEEMEKKKEQGSAYQPTKNLRPQMSSRGEESLRYQSGMRMENLQSQIQEAETARVKKIQDAERRKFQSELNVQIRVLQDTQLRQGLNTADKERLERLHEKLSASSALDATNKQPTQKIVTPSTPHQNNMITIVEEEHESAEDIPLVYISDSLRIDGDVIKIKGRVKNHTNKTYKWVKVYFTVTANGAFITRENTYAEPSEIGPGQLGYIDTYLRIPNGKPDKITWKIIGRL